MVIPSVHRPPCAAGRLLVVRHDPVASDIQLATAHRSARAVQLVALHPRPPGIGRPIENPDHPDRDRVNELRRGTSIKGQSRPRTQPGRCGLGDHLNCPITTAATTITNTSAGISFSLGGSGRSGAGIGTRPPSVAGRCDNWLRASRGRRPIALPDRGEVAVGGVGGRARPPGSADRAPVDARPVLGDDPPGGQDHPVA